MAQVRSYMNQMFPATRCWRPPPAATVAATILVAAVLVGVQPASADIGIESVSRSSGIPGEQVDLLIYCGGCLPRAVRLPVSLLPAGDSPGRHPCRATSCARTAPAPPASAPYVPLGIAIPLHGGAGIASRLGLEIPDAVELRGAGAVRQWVASINRLRFQIPDAEPGLYTYVVYCCGRAPGGDLIGHPERRPSWNRARLAYAREHGQFLRVRPGASRADEPGGPPWPLWTAIAALTLIVLFAVWRRRATRSG
jgi:hypothetical protein